MFFMILFNLNFSLAFLSLCGERNTTNKRFAVGKLLQLISL